MILITVLKSSSIDGCGNWSHQTLVGAIWKIQGTAGRFLGNLVSGNQTCKQPPTGTVALRELQWRYVLNTIPPETPTPMMGGRGWVKMQNQQTKQWSTNIRRANKLQVWQPEQSFHPQKCSSKISWAGNCKYGNLITLSPLRGSTLTGKIAWH